MRRFGLCTLAALGLLIILQFSLMGNAALSAIASVSEGTTSTPSSQPIGQLSSGVLFTESVGLLDEPARFQLPASGAEFEEFQSIPTSAGNDWEFFTIDGDHYLAVANLLNDSTWNINSKLYRWNGSGFVEFQSIPTHGGHSWEFFTIGSDHYLAVANLGYNSNDRNINSKIYRWDGSGFVEFQSIPTNGATDWRYFTIDSHHYLAVANFYNNSTYNIDSKLYRWDGTSFVQFQSIPTSGAFKWEFFTIGSDHYLAVANYWNGSTHSFDSKLYRWDGMSFVEFQSISTKGPNDWEFFTIGSDHYLAVANRSSGTTIYGPPYNVDSKIYRWNGSAFVEFQSIPTIGAGSWEHFTIGSNHYLALASFLNDSTYNVDSKLYRWDGTSFVEFQSIPTNGAIDWEYFTIGSQHYLAVANYKNDITRNIDSKLYKFVMPSIQVTKTGPTTAIASRPITYTLTITNSGSFTATNLTITDTLPTNATYVSGGTLAGDVVSWNVPTLAPSSTTTVEFVVTATETITNSDYGVTADGGYSATGSEVVVTEVTPPALLAIYALAFDTLPANDLSWTYSDAMQGLRAATASDASKRALVVVDMPGADNTFVYELQGGNETLISGLPDTSGNLSSAIHEYDMTDGATLGGFLLWARNTYSADKTTFSYVGHGGPLIPETDFDPIFDPNAPPPPSSPSGLFPLPTRQDADPSFTDVTPNANILSVYQLSEALRIGTNDGTNPLDVADLVHCFASTIEEYVALHAYADAMTGSPNYAFFAPEMLGKALDGIDPSADGNTIADSIIEEYDSAIESHDDLDTPTDDHPRLLVAVDSDKIPAIKQKWNEVSYYLWQNFNKTKIENAYLNSAHYDTTYCLDEDGAQDWTLASPDAVVDLKKFATELKQAFGSPVSTPVNTLELLIDDAIINRYKQNGQPWFADAPQPTWDFDDNSGIGIYADFVGRSIDGETHLSWHAHFYTDTPSTDNPHPYAFLQGDFAGINWADVFYRFWEGTSNLKTDACLPELPPLPDTGELAVTQIIFPQAATVTDNSPVQIMAAISTAHAAVHTTVAFTVTQSNTTVFSDVVHIPGVLMTGTHSVQASQLWSPALANPAVAEPFTVEVMVDHDNHVSEPNEQDNLLTMSDVVAPALANPRPIITATIANNLQWITDPTASLHVVQAPSTQPPPVQTVEVQVYQYVAGSTPNIQVPTIINSQTFSSVSLPQAVNVSLSGLTPGPVVLHAWAWSTGGVTTYPSIVKFNYIPPNTALAAGEQHDFLFYPNAGDTLEFNLNALTGDPNMFLWLPTNFGVPTWSATVDDSDYLNPNAPVQGEYLLSVYGQSSGTYTLTTTRNGVPYARRAARANNPNAYVPDGRPTFSEPIPEAPEVVASTSISLRAGWNHASLSLQPLVGYSAQTLCDQINEQGGDAVEIDRWHNAGWEGHLCGLPFNDFDLQLGESYFIRSNSASNWTIAGYRVAEALPLTVQTGWNSISIPHTDSYTAESLCDDLISQGVDVVEIDRWHHSGWQGHICGVPFNNFNLERHTGYFIKSNSSGTMSPTAQALIRQPLNNLPAPPEAVSTAQAVPIHDLQRSNLRDTSVTLSWTTQQATTGYVRFGETPETMSQVAYDSRGATSSRTTHQVVLNHLTPETSYYFEIISGAEAQQSEREPYTVTTLSPLDNVPPSDTIYGQIYQADGVTPATGTLVYLQLQDADDAGSPKEAGLISALVDEQGYWHANLGNARPTQGSGSFAYAIKSDRLLLTTQRAAADTVTHTLDTSHLRPAQPLTLPPQAGWQLYLPLIQN